MVLLNRCAPDWESNNNYTYTVCFMITGFWIPLSVILYSSFKTVMHMKAVSIRNTYNFSVFDFILCNH